MASNAQLLLKPAVASAANAAGNQFDFLRQLQSALQGGTGVYNLFSSYHQPLQTFFPKRSPLGMTPSHWTARIKRQSGPLCSDRQKLLHPFGQYYQH